jgi:hypothetical protein
MRNALAALETETERLKGLYALSEVLFSQSLQRVCALIKTQAPLGVEWKGKKVFVAANEKDLSNKLRKQFPMYLRELIFARLISSALDVFLVDVVEEIPSVSPATREQLAEARNLEAICTIYNTKLSIDLKKFPDWTRIKEMQELRHELVHRLGWAKPAYRAKYNPPHPKVSVTVQEGKHDHPNLWELTDGILSFAEWVCKNAVPRWPADRRSVYQERKKASLQIINEMLFPAANAPGKEGKR